MSLDERLRTAVDAVRQCLVCRGIDHRTVFIESGIDILRCRSCGHVFSSYPSDPNYDGFWGDEVAEEEKFYWRSARRRMFQHFIARFVAGRQGRLLDVGCGLGYFLEAVRSDPGWEPYGCEISPVAARHARDTLGLSNVICGRLEDADVAPASFDIITLWDVLDHYAQPDALLARCEQLLTDDGICFIRVPNVAVQLLRARIKRLLGGVRPGVACLQPRDHAHHYSATSIGRLLARNGFSNVHFVHLPPVEDAPGALWIKKLGFQAVRAIAVASRGSINFDNFFVVARKGCKTKGATGSAVRALDDTGSEW
jgi:SAM-dependent methyltransferase